MSNENTSNVIRIPLSTIDVDYEFNVRIKHGAKGGEHYRGVEQLAADIKKDGQLTPVIVRPAENGRYKLVAGFRRCDAMKSLGMTDVDAKVMEIDDLRAAVLNAKENTSRDGLTTYEFAQRCCQLRDRFALSQAKIANEFAAGTDYRGEGMSRSYIGNLMRAFDKLAPVIKDAWKNENPALTTDQLIKWGAMEQDEQVEEWEEMTGVGEDGEPADGEETPDEGSDTQAKKGPRKASASHLGAALRAVKNDPKLSETVQDAILATLDFALGKRKTLKVGAHVVYDPKAKKVKKEENEE